ncbi:beta-lactamase/transpeptidase-like protein [Mycena rebaudengoi]|nr:beta-lactamase/transpeptidase-like protein [Mycena rebaudengoi]
MVSLSLRQQDGIRRLMSKTILNKELPAMFFAATDANGEFFSHQAGTTAEDAPIFWVCSQTKLITSIAAMQLIEQGKIQLSTPVAQILPELANPIIVTSALDQDGKMANTEITFLHLLTHTSGLEYNPEGAPYARSYEDSSAFLKMLQGPFPAQPIKFEPGTDFAYGFSTDCVGFIVERLSGKSLDTYFKDHIFSPLGITSATFYLTPALKERLLPLSFRNPEGN